MTLLRSTLGIALCTLLCASAQAELRVCNKTGYQASVAVGYQDGKKWVSEGWWNIDGGKCAVVVQGKLRYRNYYLYATHEIGGGWGGDYYFCTSAKSFTIVGDKNCDDRGYDRNGFYKVDTGDSTSHTANLTDE